MQQLISCDKNVISIGADTIKLLTDIQIFTKKLTAACTSIRLLPIPVVHSCQNLRWLCWLHTKTGPKKGQRCNHSTWSLVNHWAAFLWVQAAGRASPILPETFWTHGWTNFVGSLVSEKWFNIQGLTNFTAAHFVGKCHAVNSSQKRYVCRWHLGCYSFITKIHDHRWGSEQTPI